jgi:hypothetical protein
MQELAVLTDDVLTEIKNAFYDIPFENSDFQNANFVLAAQITPARAYRAIGLRMSAKLRAIDELKYARMLEEVDMDERQAKIDDPSTSEFDRRRAVIESQKALSVRDYTDKLLNDAIHDLNFMYAEFKKYPTYTRAQFEMEEHQHFSESLSLQVDTNGNGALQSLSNMEHGLTNFSNAIEWAKANIQALPSTVPGV